MIKVIMHGCNGKMGQCITEICAKDPDIEIVAGIDIVDDSSLGFPVFQNYGEVNVKADVIIDFSNPALLEDMLTYASKTKTAVVLATTGLSDEQISRVESVSKEIAVFFSICNYVFCYCLAYT